VAALGGAASGNATIGRVASGLYQYMKAQSELPDRPAAPAPAPRPAPIYYQQPSYAPPTDQGGDAAVRSSGESYI